VVALVPRGGFDTYALTQTPLQRAGSIWRNQPRVALRPAAKLFTHLGQDSTANPSGHHRYRWRKKSRTWIARL